MATNYPVNAYLTLTGTSESGGTLSWSGSAPSSGTNNVVDHQDDGNLDIGEDNFAIANLYFTGYYITSGGHNWAIYYNGSSYFIPYDSSNSPVDAGAITLGTSGSTSNYSDNLVDEIVCFLQGTIIETVRGPRAVEELVIGDVLVSNAQHSESNGGAVKFIHRMAVDKHSAFANVSHIISNPVLLRAGSLSESSPNRDLLVSPDHAILVNNEVLVEARALVNGKSILYYETDEAVDYYYHIELENHSLVSAHNTLSESYIDNVSRAMFDTYEEYKALYPAPHFMEELDYPRAKSWRQIPRHIKLMVEERKDILFPEPMKSVV